jgi:hypothetical protein
MGYHAHIISHIFPLCYCAADAELFLNKVWINALSALCIVRLLLGRTLITLGYWSRLHSSVPSLTCELVFLTQTVCFM